MNSLSITIDDLAGTEAFGRRLGCALFPGAVIALIGCLGAGKTHLTRAIAEGLGIANSMLVNSPTFVLIQEYEARLPIYHFDTYRLKNEAEFADLGAHEYFASQGVCVVEWADQVPGCLPRERLEIRLTVTGEATRRFDLMALGMRYEEMLRNLDVPRAEIRD